MPRISELRAGQGCRVNRVMVLLQQYFCYSVMVLHEPCQAEIMSVTITPAGIRENYSGLIDPEFIWIVIMFYTGVMVKHTDRLYAKE
jgi:hypothetical protein